MNENNDNTMNSRNKYNCIPVVFLHGPFVASLDISAYVPCIKALPIAGAQSEI